MRQLYVVIPSLLFYVRNGTLERSNVVIFDVRLFSLIITVGLTVFLFNNVKLRRLFSPFIMRLFQDHLFYFILSL